MMKKMENEKNIIIMVNYFLKENIYVIIEEEEKLNMKENIYSIIIGQEKNMMKKEMSFMN